MNPLLDTVEPDIYEYDGLFTKYVTSNPHYSRHKVESMLAECRKQTLLEAAEYFGGNDSTWQGKDIAYKLRRMAEGEKE